MTVTETKYDMNPVNAANEISRLAGEWHKMSPADHRARAEIEFEMWKLVTLEHRKQIRDMWAEDRSKYPRGCWLQTTIMCAREERNAIRQRETLYVFGPPANPLWERLEKATMTLHGAVQCVRDANKIREGNPSISLAAAVHTAIAEMDAKPVTKVVNGVTVKANDSTLASAKMREFAERDDVFFSFTDAGKADKAPDAAPDKAPEAAAPGKSKGSKGKARKSKATTGHGPSEPSPESPESPVVVGRDYWSDIRARTELYLKARLPPNTERVVVMQLEKKIRAALGVVVAELSSAIERIARDNRVSAEPSKRVLAKACQTLHMDPPLGHERRSKVALEALLKKAQRNKKALARDYHPDANSGGGNPERFRAVIAAYEVVETWVGSQAVMRHTQTA